MTLTRYANLSWEAIFLSNNIFIQNEYISEHDERRKYVTGFDGSAGTAVITTDKALLWTDGRYYQQAEKQMDSNWTLMKDGSNFLFSAMFILNFLIMRPSYYFNHW